MLEPWDELLNLQRERQLCADDLEIIKTACARDHGKKHVIQCPECWDRLLNRMRDRYLNSSAKEWFSGRRLFLQELDTMFSKARGGSLDFKTIEQRINDEKQEWYRDKVKNIGLLSAAKSTPEARRLQQTLNDSNLTIDELASELRGSISDNAPWNEAALESFLDRLKDAKTLQARNDIYVNAFFHSSNGAHGAGQYEKYTAMVRNGTPIPEVVNAMLRDRRSAQSEQDQKQRLQAKLDELKRAKAAHELSLAKKHKARQDRATAAAAAASEEQSQLAPCTVCLKTLNAQDFLACPLCQLLNEQYEQAHEPVVYCSQKCHDSDYVRSILYYPLLALLLAVFRS
ncbi:hypothetical protein SLS62_007648 [Diatrype stigma]|uniref:Uncharacterized protein n=1 Tax=Diatrype stigma TaxID=117547 RepID=A0AAN9UZ05_9PEZI